MKFFNKNFSNGFSVGLLLLMAITTWAVEFPNPSLDEDSENDKSPDKWLIPKTTEVTLVTDKVSHGSKAARFDNGYVLLNCNMQEKSLPGLKLAISFDAAGKDDAALGVMLGYFRKIDGKVKFSYSRLTWNRKLTSDYQKIQFYFTIPKSAVKERIWFGIYRSNKKGTVWLDNFNLTSSRGQQLTIEQKKQLTRLDREWTYLASRINKALKIKNSNDFLLEAQKQVAAKLVEIKSENTSLLDKKNMLAKDMESINVKINQLLAPNKSNFAWFGDAYVRQSPVEIIPESLQKSIIITSLGNEYQAIGLTVASCENTVKNIPIAVKGLDKIAAKVQVRRQVFQQNWYDKEKERLTDALTLLSEVNKTFDLTVAPGEMIKLYIGFKVKENIHGEFPIQINAGTSKLEATLKVLNRNLPTSPHFANFQCVYPQINPAAKYPELAAEDLAEHYTTGIEFPFIPPAAFNKDGSIARENFERSPQTKWLKAYAAKGIKLGLFWEGNYNKFPLADAEGYLPFIDKDKRLLPEWKKAYSSLLRDWLTFTARNGYGKENFLAWSMDELASHEDFKNAPGTKVKLGIEIYKITKAVEPELPRMVTAGNYTLPEDVEAFLPHVDIILPAWPMPVKLTRWSPADYNPRKEFFSKTLQRLKKARQERGLIIWSYKVDRGKKEPVLNARAYPVCAVGIGFTGVGSWAYNCTRGLSWDDTDKGLLDYSFIYNGKENHPLNKKYNVTGETIVPSIRWEAFRMGIQDAKILLYLKDCVEKGKCDQETSKKINSLLEKTNEYGRELNYSFAKINEISAKIRELVLEIK
jgi:hypothetical protein